MIYKSLMHLDENDLYVVRKGGENTATSKKRGMRKPYLMQRDETDYLSMLLKRPIGSHTAA